jgi:NadR type nicotinamide-nucleotide adenylyltransferase
MSLRKIVVNGPESTGKSSLCEALAAHYHTGWVPEYAREYLMEKQAKTGVAGDATHGVDYAPEDLSRIARGQVALENRLTAKAKAEGQRFLFIDTDLYVIKIWSEFVFDRCDPWILDQIAVRHYDAYLLCKTDLPWEKDDLREYPDPAIRERLYLIYREALIQQSTPWEAIGGQGDQRIGAAIAAVQRLLLD